jgi:O-antigen/teichoic acid export membrane protein
VTQPLGQAYVRRFGLAANTILRAATIGVRSALVIGLAVWLQPAEFGLYGVIGATITLTTYLYGLDFYTFTWRELSNADLSKALRQLRDQFAMLCVVYLVGSLALVSILPEFGLSRTLAALTAAVAVFQHASLEFYRVFLRLEKTILASLCLLIRDAAWVPLCLVFWLFRGALDLSDILLLWLVGSLIAVAFGVWSFFRIAPAAALGGIDLPWLAKGIKTGLRMLGGTLSLRGLFTVDRMILALIVSPDALGAYVFFAAVCGVATAMFETAIMPFFWPRFLEAVRHGDNEEQAIERRALARVCVMGALGTAAVGLAGGALIAAVLPHAAYREHLWFLAWLASAHMFLILSNIPHYRLYATNRDSAIVRSNAAAFVCFLAIAGSLVLASAEMAVPIALSSASALLLSFKWAAVRRYRA